jgi:hypothetical protein
MKVEEQKFIQSYVYSKFGEFFVSTCYRRSSSVYGGWYYETFAWKMENKKRTDFVADNSGSRYKEGAYKQHIEVCRQLDKTGKFNET